MSTGSVSVESVHARRGLRRTLRVTARIQPRRRIEGISAVLLPFRAGDAPDYDALAAHVARTAAAGLIPAVNMDTGYVDRLTPAQRAQVLRVARETLRDAPFVAVANCGFPEAHHNDTALGVGPVLDGKPLAEAGGMARNMVQALDVAAPALAQGQSLPQEAMDLMSKPLVPPWMYATMGNLGWRLQARKHGTWQAGHPAPRAMSYPHME